MVKAHQDKGNGKELDLRIRGDVRQGLSLNRLRIPQGNEEEELVQVPESGKPDAVKVARPVWNGGKAARPYLSLRVIDVEALPEHPAEAKAEFTLTIYQGTTTTVRRVEQTPGLLRGIRALLRQLEYDTGTPRVVEGIAILPYGHYVWSGEGGAWSVYLYDEDMDAEQLSKPRETARARRQLSRLRWQERTHPNKWANSTPLAKPTQRPQN